MMSKTMSTKRRPTPRRPSASTAVSLPWLREQGAVLVSQIRTRLDKEGRKAYRQLKVRVADLQKRLGRDTANLGHRVDDAVRGTLARLNIPNRREIGELTRKVDELSRKIDAFQARSRRKARRA